MFSNQTGDVADRIIDHIDPYRLFRSRLYGKHLSLQDDKKFKDLVKIGRDPKSLVLLDNIFYPEMQQADQTICVHRWYGSRADTVLKEMIPALLELSKIDDCRDAIVRMSRTEYLDVPKAEGMLKKMIRIQGNDGTGINQQNNFLQQQQMQKSDTNFDPREH